ncbi:hypothetical protein RCIX1811 [Methanocella arvoryzae MRE50]|uniref:Uncharacterized protein n=1 Tax=Methanocella arvoryzae (strain DSM 22066 / NBRC 105507 / MRE50) TaxID=351160 RepID=Q0W3P0_METAR|nr:hypothetical protein RCIX1811 [Methanocella arvoryzae MRE50]
MIEEKSAGQFVYFLVPAGAGLGRHRDDRLVKIRVKKELSLTVDPDLARLRSALIQGEPLVPVRLFARLQLEPDAAVAFVREAVIVDAEQDVVGDALRESGTPGAVVA